MNGFKPRGGGRAGRWAPGTHLALQKMMVCAGACYFTSSSLIAKSHPEGSLPVPTSAQGDSLMDNHMVPKSLDWGGHSTSL